MADFMSRKPVPGDLLRVEDLHILCIEEELIDAHTIVTVIQQDPILKRVLQHTVYGWPQNAQQIDLQPYYVYSKHWILPVSDNVLLWNDRVVIPTSSHSVLLHELQSERSGSVHMKQLACRYFWWPKMDDKIEQKTKHHLCCQEQARRPSRFYST